ncbi:unnamed protein product [Alopecurus aequalis]
MSPRPHFLVLTFPLQGHIAPALRLAKRLLDAVPDALVTFSTTEAAHRCMFPANPDVPHGAAESSRHDDDDGRLEFHPFSDGTESGYVRGSDSAGFNQYMASLLAAGPRSVGELVDALAARGRPGRGGGGSRPEDVRPVSRPDELVRGGAGAEGAGTGSVVLSARGASLRRGGRGRGATAAALATGQGMRKELGRGTAAAAPATGQGAAGGFRRRGGDAGGSGQEAGKTTSLRSIPNVCDRFLARGGPKREAELTAMAAHCSGWTRGGASGAAIAVVPRSVPPALYSIQPAAVFAIYYHYFHGHAGVVIDQLHDPSFLVQLPGLPPQAVRDLPSFITESTHPSNRFHAAYTTIRDLFDSLDRDAPKAKVLVNTCEELEAGTFAAVGAYDVLPIGPVLPSGDEAGLFKQDDSRYLDWLDTKLADSVVYVSFGSLARMARGQLDELLLGLEESGRPYLCIVRKDQLPEEETETQMDARPRNGMVVEWCDQVRVLSHAAVGCFVTHCGWNSVLESVACGVPMVAVPQWSDQRINSWLVECEWRVGCRAEVGSDGVLRATEVRRCIEEVMAGNDVRSTATEWKRTMVEALGKGGSSDCNLMAFAQGVGNGVRV